MQKKRRCEPLDRYREIHGDSWAEIANKLGCSEEAVRSWANGSRPIVAERAVEFEKKLGIPRETLRPDIFVKRA